MANAFFPLVIDALGIPPSKASTESKQEAARKKNTERKRVERASWTEAKREHVNKLQRARTKLRTNAERRRSADREKVRRALCRKEISDRTKAWRVLWTDVDRAKETARKRRWRAEQRAKKVQTEKATNNKQTSRPTRNCRHVSTSPCLAEGWISCSPEANCQACLSKFKPLDDKQILTKDSKIHGKGLFLMTSKKIKKNTVIALVKGKRCQKDPERANQYTIEVGNRYVQLVPPVKFLNHSCQPNCRFQKWCSSGDREKEEVAIVSNKCINPKEELTVRYCGAKPFRFIAYCNCGRCAA